MVNSKIIVRYMSPYLPQQVWDASIPNTNEGVSAEKIVR
jgi:hypothetical protein